MYENEIYSSSYNNSKPSADTPLGNSSVNSGSTGNNVANGGGSPYFDYTAYPTGGEARNAAPITEEKKTKKKRPGLRKVLLSAGLGLCFGLFAGAGFYAVKLGTGQFTQTESRNAQVETQNNTPINTVKVPSASLTQSSHTSYVVSGASEVVEAVMPSMVSIVNTYTVKGTTIWGQTYTRQGGGSGTGIIVAENDKELLIVSNNHVVEGAEDLEVTFIDGSTAKASIKGLDPDMDLAVVSVNLKDLSAETRGAIAIAAMGDSSTLRLAEPVIAIGNALGYGQTVTVGYVSALNREITMEDGSTGVFIQTDAAINEGNSGGALFNVNGEVVGISSAKIGGSTVDSIGFAIPISSASPIISELMERQTRTKVADSERGYLGVILQDIPEEIMKAYNMPEGVFIYDVEKGSAAEQAGIVKGDAVVKVDGVKVTSSTELQNTMQYYAAGETAVVTIKRLVNGEYVVYDLEVKLGKRPVK